MICFVRQPPPPPLTTKASEVDAACGAILEELRRQDVLDNTVIIFTTDNGNFHAEVRARDRYV